jgi:exopolysaccharide biosynthesis polyprenyl glycosylphosphotransferase
MIKHFSLRFSLFLLALDGVLVVFGLMIATLMRIFLPFGLPGDVGLRLLPLPVYGIAIGLHYIIYAMLDIHSPRQAATLMKELQVTLPAVLTGWLMLLGALYITYRDVSRLQIIYFLIVHVVLICLSRVGLRLVYWARGEQLLSVRRVLIIGDNNLATRMFDLIDQYRFTGLHPLGLLRVSDDHDIPNHIPVLGTLTDLPTVLPTCDVSEVVIALHRDTPIDMNGLVRTLQSYPVNIRLIPQYGDLAFLQVHIEDFSGIPLITLKQPILTPYQRVIKRMFDIVLTLLLLVPALPLMALIALLVRLDSPGPVFFQQQRVGEGGRRFRMFKFRSMMHGAEFQQELVRQYNARGQAIYKHPNDPRVTRVGRVLRVTSLDELPQLFNVLHGDMSLVGPRPELPDLVDQYQPWQRKRFQVPQGITGWWQVNGRANKPMHLHTEDDLFYIRNYSLWLDLRILWRTLWVVLSRRGAY